VTVWAVFVGILLSTSATLAQHWDLLGEPKDWTASVDRGGTKMSVRKVDGNLLVEIESDGGDEDFPKIRRIFPKPQDWRLYQRIYAKVRVTCDDPTIQFKNLAFVFYDEQTRLPDYPGNPMKQQVIHQTVPVGRWVVIAKWLTGINRATIRHLTLPLRNSAAKPQVRWEVSLLVLEAFGGETVIFDGLPFARKQIKGAVGKPFGK
jgi:hypothetical protein